MSQSDISIWLKFALQQMAAESYLDQLIFGRPLRELLLEGNNDIRFVQPDLNGNLPGKTRFTNVLADQFLNRYQIIDHHANDATGFSATLMFDAQANSYTLSFRSTESAPVTGGGDRDRDLFGADAEVGSSGFAFGQLASMEEYYQSLKASGKLPAGAVLNVTGFSLGGHLATVFTELHADEVNHTYIFNGTGRGHVSGTVSGLSAEENQIQDMLTYFRLVLNNPDNALAFFPRTSVYDQAKALFDAQGAGWQPFDQGTSTLYDDARYQWAKAATQWSFGPTGFTFLQSPGEEQDQGPFAKITQLYGQATTDDLQFVANSGVHAPVIPVFIEGQPLIAGLPLPSFTESANTHSITLIVDSLAVQELIQAIDFRYGQASAELLIKAASNAKADTVAPLNTPDVVEGDSLEKTVDAFRKLFRDPTLASADPLPINSSAGGFGDLANRNLMYAAIHDITERVTTLRAQGVAFTLTDLTDPEIDRATLLARASTDTPDGLAYRYALKELNPFVVTTNTEALTHALYAPFNLDGELDIYNLTTGTGTLTAYYLDDRSAFLKEKIALNQLDRDTSLRDIHYRDLASGYEIKTDAMFATDRQVLFGSDGDEGIGLLVGGSKADSLYGGGGNDLLEGGDGRDYLQGDAGGDRLDGGADADRMAGGADNDFYIVDHVGDEVIEGFNNGIDRVESSVSFTLGANVERLTLAGTADIDGTGNELSNEITGNDGINRLDGKGCSDHLIGGDNNDVLIGGLGDDLLEGGEGFDTYYYNAGDGTDQIEDSDAKGRIIFDGRLLVGGVHNADDPANIYQSQDGAFTYVVVGGHLIVNGVLTVNADFESGQFGIELFEGPHTPSYENGWNTQRLYVETGVQPDGPISASSTNLILYGAETHDDMGGAFARYWGNDQFYGYGGGDYIFAGLGHDRVYGGDGNDWILGGIYYGSQLPEGWDFSTVDNLDGDDFLDGENGDDTIAGMAGNDRLFGGEGNDLLQGDGDPTVGFNSRPSGGDDSLDGGVGDDRLYGDYGNDALSGGDGNDRLFGDYMLHRRFATGGEPIGALFGVSFDGQRAGDDFLDGGTGDDELYGDGGNDTIVGGDGNDQLFGDYGEMLFAQDVNLLTDFGDDVLDGGVGDDLVYGMEGNDVLAGGDGLDKLYGGDGADELYGGVGDDFLLGDYFDNDHPGDDALYGDDGDDVLIGAAGDDLLDGGAGNDELQGGEGEDVLFGEGGNDLLFGEAGDDMLSGADGVDTLSGGEGNDRLFGENGDDVLLGNEGNDTIWGGMGDDGIGGGVGDDVLDGGAGNDFYVFFMGDGHDVISDRTGLDTNELVFGPGISLGSLTFLHDSLQQTMTIQISGSDSITLLGFDPHSFNYVIDTLNFGEGELQVLLADQLPLPDGLVQGTDQSNAIRTGSGDDSIFAGAGNDSVNAGPGNDVILGEAGNDVLAGGEGQDTYIFNVGDGRDTVLDTPGEGNRLVFGPGIFANALTLGLEGEGSLALLTGVSGDAILFSNTVLAGGRPPIDVLEFANGSTMTIDELLARGIRINGTAESETLTGTPLIDRLSGGFGDDVIRAGIGADALNGDEGNDYLFGDDGADLLDGGSGSDVLDGGQGEDMYAFGRGYGADIVRDSPIEQFGPNTILLTEDIAPDQVFLQSRASEDGPNVVLTIAGTQDELTLLGAADPNLLPISQIVFMDGTRWDTVEILDRIEGIRVTAPSTGSVLQGTGFRDELLGGAGNDFLDGQEGPDRMIGGAGDDHYWVDHSGDVVVEAVDEGMDTVLSVIDYRLPDHVENLVLRATAQPDTDPIHGEGNSGSNRLLGNFVSNVLVGGEGADTLWGGFSVGGDYGWGDDALYGGSGNDTYIIEGDFNGFDTIYDVALPAEENRLQFGGTVRPSDVVFVHEGSSLRLTNQEGAHGVILSNFDPSGMNGSLVTAVVSFSSGVDDFTGGYETNLLTLMDPTIGTDDADVLVGTSDSEVIKSFEGDDVVVGGPGNDVLIGGPGDDIYVFSQGDGFDLIDDQPGDGGVNSVRFGSGITPDMLQVEYNGAFGIGSLTVRVGLAGDGLHFLGVPAEEPMAQYDVDAFYFVDGTQLTFAQLFEREILVHGTGRSDGELFGTFANDRMLGLSGSETLSSGAGDDMLIGGAGNDVLDGGEGSDTYLFNLGDGIDEILDEAASSWVNRLRFGSGITVSDLALFDAGDGCTVNRIKIGRFGDVILLPNRIDYTPALTLIEFADGVTLDLYDLHAANQVTVDQTIVGEYGDQVLLGGIGNDRIFAGTGATTLLGLAGDDLLVGEVSSNLLMGGHGNDMLQGEAGNDTYLFNFGDGTDTIEDMAAAGECNRIQFGVGITQSDLTFVPDEVEQTLTIRVGSGGADRLILTNFDSTGVNGSLVVETLAFADGSHVSLASLLGPSITIFGSDKSEVLVGTVSNDGIDAGSGDDTIYGNAGNDLILAGAGSDSVSGDDGADVIFGGSGTDYLYGGEGDDVINGDGDNDVVVGDAGNDILAGSAGNDTLNGGAGADHLSGGEGDDTLYIDAADTSVSGGAGYDAVTVVGTNAVIFDATTAEVEFVAGNSGNDVFTAAGSVTGVTFYGGDGDDRLTGGDGNDVLVGQAGADTLTGGLGNDVLNGGDGDDSLAGDIGDDTFYAGAGNDQISGGAGSDSVSGDDGADVIFGGSGTDYLYGGEGDDVLNGGDGDNDVVVGDAGNDTLSGGTGNDVLNGGAGADHLSGGEGDDTLYIDAADTSISGGAGYDAVTVVGTNAVIFDATTAEVEFVAGNSGNDVFTAAGSVTGVTFYGGDGDDRLTGGDGNDVLVGQAGADSMMGGLGNDVLNGGDGDDHLSGELGNDTVYGGIGNDWISGGDGDDAVNGEDGIDTILGGSGGDYLSGGDGDDVISGDDGNDTLVGQTGNDTIAGGAGNDYLVGGTGNDEYLFTRGGGADTISEDEVTAGNTDRLGFGAAIDPLDLILSRQANDLRVAIHGTNDQVVIENWYLGEAHHVETIQVGSGQALLNTQVDQLIHAMAAFTEQTGVTWDQAIDQRAQDVQAVLAASWQ
jgi:Ca2+-binding RTX toxin-like protein